MRFTIEKESFNKAMGIVSHAVGGKNVNPVLLCFKLEVTNNGLSLIGYNQEIAIRTIVPFDVDGRTLVRDYSLGGALIQARLLNDVVRRMEGNEVTIEVIDGSIAKIDDGKSSFKLYCMSAEEYPDIDFTASASSFELPATVLSSLVEQTSFAALTKDGRPALTAVNLKQENGQIVSMATDGARLSKKSVDVEGNLSKFTANIPAKALSDISKLPEPRDVVQISFSQDSVIFEFGNTVVSSRLIPGSYPVTGAIIPHTYAHYLEVNAKEIISAIDRLAVLSQGGAPVVKLTMTDRTVEVSSANSQTGSGVERINTFQYSGERLEIAFNSIFVCEAIRALGSEDVNFNFVGEMKPFVIKNPNDDSIVELITPMRTR